MTSLTRCFGKCVSYFARIHPHKLPPDRLFKALVIGIGSGMFSVANVGVTLNNKAQKLRFPDPSSLTHTALIRNACGLSVDAASALLSQTTAALIQEQQQCIERMEQLIQLLETSVEVTGNRPREDQIWDEIVATRASILQHHRDIQELELIFKSADKTLKDAAEACFLAGAETYSFMASERAHSAQQYVDGMATKLHRVKEQLTSMEADMISKLSKIYDVKIEEEKSAEDGVRFEELLDEKLKKENEEGLS